MAFQSTPGTPLKTLNSSKQLSCWSSAIPAEQNSRETIKHPNTCHFLSYLSLKQYSLRLLNNAKGILTVPSRHTGYFTQSRKNVIFLSYILAFRLLQFQRQLERHFQIWIGERFNLCIEGIFSSIFAVSACILSTLTFAGKVGLFLEPQKIMYLEALTGF